LFSEKIKNFSKIFLDAETEVMGIYATDKDNDPINKISKLEVVKCGIYENHCPYFRIRQENLNCHTIEG